MQRVRQRHRRSPLILGGSGNLDLLQHWLQIGRRARARFSFFLSGVYLLDRAHKDRHVGPHHSPGASAVGFAKVPAGMTGQQYMTALTERLNLGNRTPIDLGNHFERWNDSAYTKALTRFVLTECVKPEVRCVPYRDLVGWLDARSPQQLAAFQSGTFRHLAKSTGRR